MRKLLSVLVLCALSPAAFGQEEAIVGPAQVLDADTMRIDGKLVVLYGVDGLERNQPCLERDRRVWQCGRVATRQLALYVDRKEVRCEPKGKPDVFRRIPAVCFAGGENLNDGMVRKGLALALRDQTADFVAAEEEAKTKKTGMWRGSFMPPWEYREMMVAE